MDFRGLRESGRDIELDGQSHGAFRDRRELQGQLHDGCERSERPAPEASEVVAGDVLHDLAARPHRGPVAQHDARAYHPVPRMKVAEPRGPTGRARERPAHGGAVVHSRLDRPALLAEGKGIGKVGERGPSTNGRDEIVWLVFDDSAEA